MGKCHPTKLSEVVMIPSTPSSPRLALASTSHVPSSSIWNQLLSMRSELVLTDNYSTPNSSSLVKKMPPTTTPVVTTPLVRKSSISSSTESENCRSVYWSPGFLDLPLLRWWNRIWIRFPLDGASLGRLRKEIQVGIRHLPSPTGLYRCCRAIQLHPHHPHHLGALRLCLHG